MLIGVIFVIEIFNGQMLGLINASTASGMENTDQEQPKANVDFVTSSKPMAAGA